MPVQSWSGDEFLVCDAAAFCDSFARISSMGRKVKHYFLNIFAILYLLFFI
jgi:hypothetical protein